MGRLSNPPGALETGSEQGLHAPKVSVGSSRTTPIRSSEGRRASLSNNVGRLSNPSRENLHVDAGTSTLRSQIPDDHHLRPSVQLRLNHREVENMVDRYLAGHTVAEIAELFGVHRQTVSSHLESLGIPRRVNVAKLSPSDVQLASTRYLSGESLATCLLYTSDAADDLTRV